MYSSRSTCLIEKKACYFINLYITNAMYLFLDTLLKDCDIYSSKCKTICIIGDINPVLEIYDFLILRKNFVLKNYFNTSCHIKFKIP